MRRNTSDSQSRQPTSNQRISFTRPQFVTSRSPVLGRGLLLVSRTTVAIQRSHSPGTDVAALLVVAAALAYLTPRSGGATAQPLSV
jgi:hypothetical protein